MSYYPLSASYGPRACKNYLAKLADSPYPDERSTRTCIVSTLPALECQARSPCRYESVCHYASCRNPLSIAADRPSPVSPLQHLLLRVIALYSFLVPFTQLSTSAPVSKTRFQRGPSLRLPSAPPWLSRGPPSAVAPKGYPAAINAIMASTVAAQRCSMRSPLPCCHMPAAPRRQTRRCSKTIARAQPAVGSAMVKERWWEKNPQPNLLEAHSFEDIASVLQQNQSSLVLLDFYAPWCNACKSLYPKLNKLCVANPGIVIVKVNWQENKALAKTMGVKVRSSPPPAHCDP